MATVPVVDRPREKLARVGAEALGDNELVALVLGSGTRSRGALIVAHDVIDAAGGVQGLVRIGLDELCRGAGRRRVAGGAAAGGGRTRAPHVVRRSRRAAADAVDERRRRVPDAALCGLWRRAVRRDAARSEAAGDPQRDPVDRHDRGEHLASARRVPRRDAGVGVVRGGVSQPPVGRSDAERRTIG